MKITCSACHASYNLPDEKVAGRRVKVRCKRCSEPIIVDGSKVPSIPPPDEEDEATRVMDSPLSGGAAPHMWTVNLSDTEQGDMTNEELVAGWQAGIVTEDAYVWREGMDDWEPILEVPELISLLSQAESQKEQQKEEKQEEPEAPQVPEPEPEPEPEAPEPAAAVPQPQAPSPSPPQAAQAAPSPSAPTAPRPPKAAVSPARPNADLFADRPKPRREKPKYEAATARNENSVLFSLDALKAAAESTDDEDAPMSTRVDEDLLTLGMGPGPAAGAAPLIQVEPPRPVHAKAGSVSPDLSFEPQKKGGMGWLWGLVAGLVIAGGAWFGYTNFLQPQPAPTATPVVSAAPSDEPKEKPAKTEKQEGDEDSNGTAGASGTKNVADKTIGAATPSKNDKTPSESPGSSTDSKEAQTSTDKTPGSGDTPTSSTGDDDKKDDDKDDEKDDDKPPFNTEAARAALGGAASQASSCKTSDGPTGRGKVQVTFVPSGRVTSANVVSGPFGGTSVGGCVARIFRKARVPAFSGDAQIVSKSFKIPE